MIGAKYLHAVSDLKLYKIQASRACNFIKFQARLESSRPHKSLRQQGCCDPSTLNHSNAGMDRQNGYGKTFISFMGLADAISISRVIRVHISG